MHELGCPGHRRFECACALPGRSIHQVLLSAVLPDCRHSSRILTVARCVRRHCADLSKSTDIRMAALSGFEFHCAGCFLSVEIEANKESMEYEILFHLIFLILYSLIVRRFSVVNISVGINTNMDCAVCSLNFTTTMNCNCLQ